MKTATSQLVQNWMAELAGLKMRRQVAENDVHVATTRLGIIDQDMRELEILIDRAEAGVFPFDLRMEHVE
jgi:hypothetical protein